MFNIAATETERDVKTCEQQNNHYN